MLEVVDKGSATDSHPVSLLFVHGTWHAAWCWDEHFLDFFADKGYRAVALSLRGHGASSLSKPLKSCSIADYLDDVHAVVGKLGSPPVLIGHSVGGFIVHKYLESHDGSCGGVTCFHAALWWACGDIAGTQASPMADGEGFYDRR
jgi:pimeloyl-ACP methyl ester carboxylesterase